jgi:glycine/serine hydroxymethyltransferase
LEMCLRNYKLVTSGTDNHLVLWDLRPEGISGNKMEKVCEMCHITLNKNAVFGDASALSPGGVRIGAPAMTSRGLLEADFEQVASRLTHIIHNNPNPHSHSYTRTACHASNTPAPRSTRAEESQWRDVLGASNLPFGGTAVVNNGQGAMLVGYTSRSA